MNLADKTAGRTRHRLIIISGVDDINVALVLR